MHTKFVEKVFMSCEESAWHRRKLNTNFEEFLVQCFPAFQEERDTIPTTILDVKDTRSECRSDGVRIDSGVVTITRVLDTSW